MSTSCIPNVLHRSRFVLAALIGLCAATAAPAQDFTWDGDSGDDELWTNGDNWVGGDAPPLDLDGGQLIFGPTGGVEQSPDAAADDYINIHNIFFTGADASLTLIGTGSLSFSSDLPSFISNDSFFEQTINIDLIANGNFLVLQALNADLMFGGSIDLSGDPDDPATLRFSGTNDITIDGRILGDGDLEIRGSGVYTLNGNNTYTGGTSLESSFGATLVLGHDNALGTGDLTVMLTGALESDDDDREIDNDISIAGGEFLIFSGGNNLTLAGVITGDGGLEIDTDGDGQRLILTGANEYLGDTILTRGTLVLGNDDALGEGNLVLQGDGTLRSTADDRTIDNEVFLDVNRLTFTGGNDLELAGQLHDTGGAGEIVKGGQGSTLTISADSSTTYTGMVRINAGAVFLSGSVGGDVIVNDTGTLAGGGSLGGNLENNDGGTVRVGDGVGTLTVGGDYTQAAGSTLAVELSAADLTNDLLDITGNAVLEADSTIAASLVGDGYIPNGSEFTILQAASIIDNGVELEFDTATVTLSLRRDVDFMNGDSIYAIELFRAANAYEAAADGRNNEAIGRALDSLQPIADGAPAGDAGMLLGSLDRFNSDDYNTAVTQLSPEPYNAMTSTVVDAARAFTSQQATYLAGRRTGLANLAQTLHAVGPAPGSLAMAEDNAAVLPAAFAQAEAAQAQATEGKWSNYVRVQAVFSDQNSAPNRTGFSASLVGGQAGVDYAFTPELIGGLALGYTSTSADLSEDAGHLGDETIRGGPYMSWASGNWFVDASATFGYHFYDADRNIPSLDLEAHSDYDGFDVTGYAGSGYFIEVARNVFVTPNASLQYTYFDFDSYTESGAGGANLSIMDRQVNSLRSRLGANLSFKLDWGIQLVPYAFVGWEHEFFPDDDIEAQFAVGGSPFTIDTGAAASDSIYYGGGVNALLKHNVSAFLRYEGSSASDSSVSGFAAGVSIAF